MYFQLIDYSDYFYRMVRRGVIPTGRGGKFVQLNYDDTEFVVMSPMEFSRYHANIVERFCMGRQLSGYYNDKRDKYYTIDTSLEIMGGGMWKVDDELSTLHLCGTSRAYGDYDDTGLREKVSSVLTGYSVILGK
ncbi:MAG: hypothetical protein HQK89_00690 [Nitrospirae bacterium]|nr:hypothetical protein [Nitrospirota bacterium]